MENKINYNNLMKLVEDEVKKEIPFFDRLIPYRKYQELTLNLKYYCESVRSVNKYQRLEKTKPMYAKERQQSEYHELLTATRLRLKLQASDEYTLQKYVIHLRSKLEEALIERDIKKRFKMYDYICAGCLHCKVDNEKIMADIASIREKAKEIISQIPSM